MDELRGLCVCLMIAHHALFTLGYLFGVGWAMWLFDTLAWFSPFFAGVFILLCGVSCHLSHSNLRRGLRLLLIAVGMTVVLLIVMPGEVIWFGVLHFLAVALLIYAGLHRPLDRVPARWALPLCAVLFCLFWHMPPKEGGYVGLFSLVLWRVPESLQAKAWLAPLGLGSFVSADYFPLFPWLFCFLAGTVLGRAVKSGRVPAALYRRRVPALAFVGRNALWLYLLHQPVIYGLCRIGFALGR